MFLCTQNLSCEVSDKTVLYVTYICFTETYKFRILPLGGLYGGIVWAVCSAQRRTLKLCRVFVPHIVTPIRHQNVILHGKDTTGDDCNNNHHSVNNILENSSFNIDCLEEVDVFLDFSVTIVKSRIILSQKCILYEHIRPPSPVKIMVKSI